MEIAFHVPDEFAPSLDSFISHHRDCPGFAESDDAPFKERFALFHTPGLLGDMTEVRCACGARWVMADGEAYEVATGTDMADNVKDDKPASFPKALSSSVRILHRAMERPDAILSMTGDEAVRHVESFWQGMSHALFLADGCEPFDQIIMEWTSLLYEGLGYPDDTVTNLMQFRYSDAYLRTGASWQNILQQWDAHLLRYMWTEWPVLAEQARLPKDGDASES